MRGRPGPGSQVLLVLRHGALALLLAAPARSAEAPARPAQSVQEPDAAADADIGALEELRRAELAYADALADFKAGQTEQARAHLKAAFAALAGSVTDDGLAQSLRDRKSTRLNSSHIQKSRMPSSA